MDRPHVDAERLQPMNAATVPSPIAQGSARPARVRPASIPEAGKQVVPSSNYRLRLPGPTRVPERVQRAIARPVVNHRGPEFRGVLSHVEELIRPVLGTRGRVLFYSCSGTGVME